MIFTESAGDMVGLKEMWKDVETFVHPNSLNATHPI